LAWKGSSSGPAPVVPSGKIARLQRLGRLVHHAQRVALAGALDVERARTGHQRADDGPVLDVGLGDETCLRQHRVHGGDVQPGDVVGHHEMTCRQRDARHLQFDAEDAQRLARPPLDALVALRWRHAAERRAHDPQAVQHVRRQAREAPDRSHSAL
jgi:hypothetical protein